jgi:hypothetical protein
MYGGQIFHTLSTAAMPSTTPEPLWQLTPYYVPSPSGQTMKKVRVHGASTTSGYSPPTFLH